jgi:hypothetical protein
MQQLNRKQDTPDMQHIPNTSPSIPTGSVSPPFGPFLLLQLNLFIRGLSTTALRLGNISLLVARNNDAEVTLTALSVTV